MARNLKRGTPKKNAGEVIFIAVEGKTEEDYFIALRQKHKIPKQRLIIHNVGNGPASEIKRFVKELKDNKRYKCVYSSIDYTWGVADTEWERGWKECASRPSEIPGGESAKCVWALSSASFERWLLLHFISSPPRVCANGLVAELSKHLPGYSHQHKGLTEQHRGKLMDRLPTALENAGRIRKGGLDCDEAFTDVDLLVSQIERMAVSAP